MRIMNANLALSAAQTAGAKQHATYEYTVANEYLKKAREEHGYSAFRAAEVYAEKAIDYAVRAQKKSSAVSSAGQSVVLPEQPAPTSDAQPDSPPADITPVPQRPDDPPPEIVPVPQQPQEPPPEIVPPQDMP